MSEENTIKYCDMCKEPIDEKGEAWGKAFSADYSKSVHRHERCHNIGATVNKKTTKCFMCGSENWIMKDEHGAICAKCYEGRG